MGVKTALQMLLVAACLAAVIASGRRQGRRRGRGRGRNREPSGENVSWTRVLSTGVSVQETAFISTEHDVVIFKSLDNSSSSLGIQTSEVYYGYEGSEPIMAISTRGRRQGKPCFVTTAALSYAELVAQIRAKNGTTVNSMETLEINAQVGSMNNSRNFSRQHPLIRSVCSRNKYYDTRTQGDVVEGEETRLIKALVADNLVEITFPVVSRQREVRRNRTNSRRGGRGNRRGGRRGNGQRNRGAGSRGRGQRRNRGARRNRGGRGNRNGNRPSVQEE